MSFGKVEERSAAFVCERRLCFSFTTPIECVQVDFVICARDWLANVGAYGHNESEGRLGRLRLEQASLVAFAS